MDLQEARDVVVDEIERALEVPETEGTARLQRLLANFANRLGDEFLDDLDDLLESREDVSEDKIRRFRDALDGVQ